MESAMKKLSLHWYVRETQISCRNICIDFELHLESQSGIYICSSVHVLMTSRKLETFDTCGKSYSGFSVKKRIKSITCFSFKHTAVCHMNREKSDESPMRDGRVLLCADTYPCGRVLVWQPAYATYFDHGPASKLQWQNRVLKRIKDLCV